MSDYVMPPHNWVPSFNMVLTTAGRLYAPGAGGKVLMRDRRMLTLDEASVIGDARKAEWTTMRRDGDAQMANAPALTTRPLFVARRRERAQGRGLRDDHPIAATGLRLIDGSVGCRDSISEVLLCISPFAAITDSSTERTECPSFIPISHNV